MNLLNFEYVPWDSATFGLKVFTITEPTRDALEIAMVTPGHYIVRVDPRSSKQLLHEFGFYYCDTLIEPYCIKESFIPSKDEKVSVRDNVSLEALLAISDGAFSHGHFHRDFNLATKQADLRYNNWLIQLYSAGKVHGLFYEDELISFIAVDGNKVLLQAIAELFRGRGLAKSLWSPVCTMMFEKGYTELVSSISATNLTVLNLHASLGFRFRKPIDVYHRLTK